MRPALWPIFLLCVPAWAQSIDYAWLNQPCVSVLNCDTGCTACNSSVNEGSMFFGNPMAFLGVDVCPHPITSGDNVLLTYGWPTFPQEGSAVLLTGIAFSPTQVDSVIVRHRAGADGPQRLQVRFGINENMPATVLADVAVPDQFGNSTFTQLGDVIAGPQMIYGYFSLLLQPYQGEGGSWDLDALRIVGSPSTITDIPDLSVPAGTAKLPRYDALGRPILERPGMRFYLDRSKRVVLP